MVCPAPFVSYRGWWLFARQSECLALARTCVNKIQRCIRFIPARAHYVITSARMPYTFSDDEMDWPARSGLCDEQTVPVVVSACCRHCLYPLESQIDVAGELVS